MSKETKTGIFRWLVVGLIFLTFLSKAKADEGENPVLVFDLTRINPASPNEIGNTVLAHFYPNLSFKKSATDKAALGGDLNLPLAAIEGKNASNEIAPASEGYSLDSKSYQVVRDYLADSNNIADEPRVTWTKGTTIDVLVLVPESSLEGKDGNLLNPRISSLEKSRDSNLSSAVSLILGNLVFGAPGIQGEAIQVKPAGAILHYVVILNQQRANLSVQLLADLPGSQDPKATDDEKKPTKDAVNCQLSFITGPSERLSLSLEVPTSLNDANGQALMPANVPSNYYLGLNVNFFHEVGLPARNKYFSVNPDGFLHFFSSITGAPAEGGAGVGLGLRLPGWSQLDLSGVTLSFNYAGFREDSPKWITMIGYDVLSFKNKWFTSNSSSSTSSASGK
jgi:hypothetical protein